MVSVVIVSFNVKEFLIQALDSLKNSLTEIDSEIIVVDNHSVDGTRQLLPEKFPEIRYIWNDENFGFSKACNQGIRISKGDFILLLNPDTIVQEDSIKVLLKFFEKHPEAGMLGCKILNADGTLQLACRRSFPSPTVALPKLLGLQTLFPKNRVMGKYNLTYLDEDKVHEVDAISGSFMFVRRKVIDEVGLLDEDFFMYGEDLDWCYRIKKKGWKIYYVPLTKIIHYHGESSRMASFDSFIAFYKAMDLFIKKHFSKSYSFLTDIALKTGIIARGLVSGLNKLIDYYLVPIIDSLLITGISLIGMHMIDGQFWSQRFTIPLLLTYLLIWVGAGYIIGLYDEKIISYSKAFVSSFTGLCGTIVFHLMINNSIHAPWTYFGVFILLFFILPGWRLLFIFLQKKRLIPAGSFISRTLLSRNTIVVGFGEEGKRVAGRLQETYTLGFNILGFVDKHLPKGNNGNFRFLGRTDYLPEIIRIYKASEVIFTTDGFTNEEILTLIDRCKHVGANFKIVPRKSDFILGKSRVERIEGVSLLSVKYDLYRHRNRILKRFFDLLIAIPVSLFMILFIVPIAFLKGYRFDKRLFSGENGKLFKGFLLTGREKEPPAWLRNITLYFSVLKGDLSIVGTRLTSGHEAERACKPGLISFQDISRNIQNGEAKNFEQYYIQHYSIFLDIEIILKSLLGI